MTIDQPRDGQSVPALHLTPERFSTSSIRTVAAVLWTNGARAVLRTTSVAWVKFSPSSARVAFGHDIIMSNCRANGTSRLRHFQFVRMSESLFCLRSKLVVFNSEVMRRKQARNHNLAFIVYQPNLDVFSVTGQPPVTRSLP